MKIIIVFIAEWMKLREPHLTLDHSTHSNPGYITDCKFNLEGEYLAVGDASGDICIYSLSHDSRLECIGEVCYYRSLVLQCRHPRYREEST